jgi:hypothetical protein
MAAIYIAAGDGGGTVYEYSDAGALLGSFNASGVSDIAVNQTTQELIVAGTSLRRYDLEGQLLQTLISGFTQTWVNIDGDILGYLPGADARGYLYRWNPDGTGGTRFASYYRDARIATGGVDGRLWMAANEGSIYQFNSSYVYGGSPGSGYALDVAINHVTQDVWTFGPDGKIYRFSGTGSRKGEGVDTGLTDAKLVGATDGTMMLASSGNGGVLGRWDSSGNFLGYAASNLGELQAATFNANTEEFLAAFSGTIYRFNTSGTLLGSFGEGMDVQAISTLVVPEPASIAVLAIGGGIVLLMSRGKVATRRATIKK